MGTGIGLQSCCNEIPTVIHTPSKSGIHSTPTHRPRKRTVTSPYFSSHTPQVTNTTVQHDTVHVVYSHFKPPVSQDGDKAISMEALRHKPCLIQEKLCNDWWKLLIATCLLNKTSGTLAIPVFHELIRKWPTPLSMVLASAGEMENLIKRLGLRKRAHVITKLSAHFVLSPPLPDRLQPTKLHKYPGYPATPISHLPGVGKYALDSFRIFCCQNDEWTAVVPQDKKLIEYLKWRWAAYRGKRWSPRYGVLGPISENYFD